MLTMWPDNDIALIGTIASTDAAHGRRQIRMLGKTQESEFSTMIGL